MNGQGQGARMGLVVIIVGAAAAACMAILWALSWFVAEKNLGRENRLRDNGQPTQEAWRDEAYDGVATAALLDDGPQRAAVVAQTCRLIDRLSDPYVTLELSEFASKECS